MRLEGKMVKRHSKANIEVIKILVEYLQKNDISIEKFVGLTRTNSTFAEELFSGSIDLKISDIEQICSRLNAQIVFDIIKAEEG